MIAVSAIASCLAILAEAQASPPKPDSEAASYRVTTPVFGTSLEQAMQLAEERTRDVIRAKADVLLVDVEKSRQIAAILPTLSFFMTAGAEHWQTRNFESRAYTLHEQGCTPSASQTCVPSVYETGATYDLSYGGYYDQLQRGSVTQGQLQAGFSLRQTLYDGGRWWHGLERVGDIRTQAEQILAAIRANARMDALRRFFDLAKAKEAVRVSSLQVQMAEANLKRAEQTENHQGAKAEATATAERNLAKDRVGLARRVFFEDSARRALNRAMGIAPETNTAIIVPDTISDTDRPVDDFELPSDEAAVTTALEHRSEAAYLRAALRIVEANIAIRRADFWPNLALVGSWYRPTTRRPDRLLSNPFENFVATVGLDLRWAFFSGGSTAASVTEGEIERTKAEANLEDVVRSIKADALERRQDLAVQLKAHQLVVESLRLARRAQTLVLERNRQGTATALELRDADQQLTQALLDAIFSRIQIEVARAELSRALGVNVVGSVPVF